LLAKGENSMSRCLIPLCAALLIAPVAHAQGVLGLPKPLDPARPGAVMLHGGGRVTDDAFDRFIELSGGPDARILFVPSAGYRPTDYATEAHFLAAVSRRYGSWASLAEKKRVGSFEFLYTDDPSDADDPAFVRPLETATGVWFSGGAQSRLNYRFVGRFPEQTRFQQALQQVIARGGVVGGTSAGMAALPEVITIRQQTGASAPTIAVTAHGLGIFDQAIVEQHFDARSGRLERFTRLLRDNAALDKAAGRSNAGQKMMGIAVEEATALVVRGDELQVLGRGNAHLFLKSSDRRSLHWHELAARETGQLRRTASGTVLLVQQELSKK
jgi:cyanophycinase